MLGMIACLGDIHGEFWVLQQKLREASALKAAALIQVGDFGFWPYTVEEFVRVMTEAQAKGYNLPVYAIEGNHEYFPLLAGMTAVTELAPNLYYVPRGTVLELDGRQVAFCGGAGSIDKGWRKPGVDWFPEEYVTEDDVAKFQDVGPVDLFISHTPSQRMIDKHFPAAGKLMFGVALDWKEPSPELVDRAWHMLGCPLWCSGHMHRRVVDGNERILDINEMVLV
jgi:predicted phosphodiesterase